MAVTTSVRRTISERLVGAPRDVIVSVRYSRFVGMMKLLLPLSAAVLILAVVAWPYLAGRDDGIPLSFATIGMGLDESVFVTNARYMGADDKNQPYTLTAELAAQDDSDPDIIRLTKPKADILLNEGTWLVLTADSGTLLRASEQLSLEGAVSIFSDIGYEFRTESAKIDLGASRAYGDAPIEGQGPFGVLNADSFRLDGKGHVIYFEGRVRMTLYPKSGS